MRAGRAVRLVGALLVAALAATLGAGSWLSAPFNHPVPRPVGVPVEDVVMESASGARVAGWLMRGDSGRGAVLLLHGIGGDRRTMVPRAKLFHAAGFSVLLIDLQGHGESQAAHVTFGFREAQDVAAAAEFLRARLPGEPMSAVAVSMGGAALTLARPAPPFRAIVLESVYPDIESAVSARLEIRLGPPGGWLTPLLLWQMPLRLGIQATDLRPLEHLDRLSAPVLLASGSADPHPTSAQTAAMYARLHAPKELWMVEGAGHDDLFDHSPDDYRRRVLGFLETYGRQTPGR
ncbi:MAG: alpha/beta fold hydrolase [Acidobacteria bacterium]|nr:alpha/beta fold hydrolase [Acidobacteriota bacterium]